MKKAKFPNDPQYEFHVRGGFNRKNKRYYDINGRMTTREKALASNADSEEETFGGSVKYYFPTPITNNFEIVELNLFNGQNNAPMSGFGNMLSSLVKQSSDYENRMTATFHGAEEKYAQNPDHWSERNKLLAVQGFDKNPIGKPMPNYMPQQILTRYNLAEHYYETDGDVANVVDIPIELLSRKIDVICSDKKLRAEIEDFIATHELESMISELWSVMREYGIAAPLEVWDDPDNPKDYVATIPLPPKSVHIGYNWAYGIGATAFGATTWTEALLAAVFPPAMFRILFRHWNDSPMYDTTGGVSLPGDFLRPIFDKRRSWMRYSMPMVSRGFRELVDRTIYEDSIRALVEGYRYQLWVFKLGDADHMPLPQVTSALMDILDSQAGDRTGQFVFWDAPLNVEVHVPKGLSEMMGTEYHGGLTKQFLRKMGITSQVIDGEIPGMLGGTGGRGSGGADKGDVNVQLYFERSRYQSKQVLDWLKYLVTKWVRYNSVGKKLPIKALDSLSFEFAPTFVEMAGRVKEIYGPMYRDGALSHRTYVGAAGIKGDVEMALKKEELPDRESGVLDPPITFSQKVVGGAGGDKTVGQTEPQGSPDAPAEQNNALKRKSNVIVPNSNDVRGIGFEAMHGHQPHEEKIEELEEEDNEELEVKLNKKGWSNG